MLIAEPHALAGWMARDETIALPDRHLGLVQAGEIFDIEARLSRAAAALHGLDDAILRPVIFEPPVAPHTSRLLDRVRIGVARDRAFSFLYTANLDTLRALGAELHFFSPLADKALPAVDALYLPGGYPELHLATLHKNRSMRAAIEIHHAAGKPILAECGGMLYLLESLTDSDGQRADMLGLLPGHAVMQKRLSAIALQRITLPEGELRGHTFHYSRIETSLAPIAHGRCPNGGRTAEAVYRSGTLTASYVHSYFPSNPEAAARLFMQ
jgi:cobyrinic acid a,c-diamide synthase